MSPIYIGAVQPLARKPVPSKQTAPAPPNTAGSGTAEFTGGVVGDSITGSVLADTIIGGGGAGLTAAVYTSPAKLSTLLF